MRNFNMRALVTAIAVTAAAGCEDDPIWVCDDSADPAVWVAVQDSVTNISIVGDHVTGILSDALFTEQMEWRDSKLVGGWDRPGTYDVEIRAEGYLTWKVTGIVVEPGTICRIDDPAELTARLVPTSGAPVAPGPASHHGRQSGSLGRRQ